MLVGMMVLGMPVASLPAPGVDGGGGLRRGTKNPRPRARDGGASAVPPLFPAAAQAVAEHSIRGRRWTGTRPAHGDPLGFDNGASPATPTARRAPQGSARVRMATPGPIPRRRDHRSSSHPPGGGGAALWGPLRRVLPPFDVDPYSVVRGRYEAAGEGVNVGGCRVVGQFRRESLPARPL